MSYAKHQLGRQPLGNWEGKSCLKGGVGIRRVFYRNTVSQIGSQQGARFEPMLPRQRQLRSRVRITFRTGDRRHSASHGQIPRPNNA